MWPGLQNLSVYVWGGIVEIYSTGRCIKYPCPGEACAGNLLAYALPARPGDQPAPPIRLSHGHTRSVFSVSFGRPSVQLPAGSEAEPLRVLTVGMDRTVLRWAVPLPPTGPDWKAAKVRRLTWHT